MCIAYIALRAHADWPLLLLANRDEWHARPSRPAAPWPDAPQVIAGRDTLGQGTWLGVTRQGRFALLTNYRDPSAFRPSAPTRGKLVSNFLQDSSTPRDYMAELAGTATGYNGFNLIVGDSSDCWYLGHSGAGAPLIPQRLEPGIHTVSNHLLNTSWPKTERLRRAVDALDLTVLNTSLEPAFAALRDRKVADDDQLPSTGLPLERERMLSSVQIIGADYGTRCSTVIAINARGRALLSEASYAHCGAVTHRHDWPFTLLQ
ncbi:MAG: NRDE family protein [Candidimonas sp.]